MGKTRAPTSAELAEIRRLRNAIAGEIGKPKKRVERWPVAMRLYGIRKPIEVEPEPDLFTIAASLEEDPLELEVVPPAEPDSDPLEFF